jgi:environmental stress-induced protein Ves
MTTTITRAADLPRVPWRNGRGLTTELALGGPPDDFAWRVSLAEVGQSGDFSLFPGIDRTIVLVEGDGMVLHLPDGPQPLARDVPFAFDGGLPVTCTVERPTRDLNLMTRRGTATGDIEVRQVAGPVELAADAAVTVMVVLDGALVLDGSDLGTGDVAVLTGAGTARLDGSARVALVRVVQAG